VILFAIIITIMGRSVQLPMDQPMTPSPPASTPQAAARPAATPAARQTDEKLVIYDFDPKSLTTTKQKNAYEKGYGQGKQIAEGEVKKISKDATPEQLLRSITGLLTERDTAIYLAVKHDGADSVQALWAFGRRDGMRAWLKDHKLPMPTK
jgi:hypothetical protein